MLTPLAPTSRSKYLLRRLLQQMQLTENGILLTLAVCVGLGSGAAVWLFREGIEFFHHIFVEKLVGEYLPFSDWGIIVAVGLSGFIVGGIVHFFIGEERHHGVAAIIESVALVGGRLPYKKMPFKAIGAALSLGAGASVGPEDPSVQIGANLGSLFGQNLRLSEDRVRLLVAAGSASAIAAAFHAPIAGVFFALEVVLGNFATGSVGVVVLAAVMSSVFTQYIEHTGPELGIRTYNLGGPGQIPFYILLGLAVAPFAVGFIRVVFWQKELWHNLHIPLPIKTALAGMIVGAAGVFFPEIMGAGREPMNEVLNTGGGDFTIRLLLALVFFKILMTSVSMAGGFVGGIFAPSLFSGAMLGGAYGRILEALFPRLDIGDPAAYAIAGMGAMMAGVVRAPITAILLIFELTNNYQLILPIMLTTVVAVFVTERFEKDGIYAKALRRVGLHIQQGRDVDVMQSVLVREVMHVPPPTISPSAALSDLRDALRKQKTKALCVAEPHNKRLKLVGIVSLKDLQEAFESAQNTSSAEAPCVADICTREVVTITPDEPVFLAIQRMGRYDYGHLPVVAPDDDRELLGMLTRNDVMRSYNIAITRKWESQLVQNQIRLSNLIDEQILTLQVPDEAQIVGQAVKDIKWPPDAIVVSIRRGNKIIHPHGSTIVKAGDRLTVVVEPDQQPILEAIINAPSLKAMNLEE